MRRRPREARHEQGNGPSQPRHQEPGQLAGSGQARACVCLIAVIVGAVWYFVVADKRDELEACRPPS
jgi:hypothetical protein